jgi:hypothetical protein
MTDKQFDFWSGRDSIVFFFTNNQLLPLLSALAGFFEDATDEEYTHFKH